MLRKSSSSSGAIQRTQGLPRNLSNPNTGSLSAGSTKTCDMGRSTKNHNLLNNIVLEPYKLGASGVDPDYVMQLVNDVRIFADVLHSLKESFQCKENQDCMQQMVQERLAELLRVLKAVIGKHQTLNSVDILGAAGTVIAKVKGVNFKEVKPENKKAIFGEIYASIDTLAFTFGNVVSDFLMGDVDSVSGSGVSKTRRSRSFDNLSVDPEGYGAEKPDLAEVALSREEEVDRILLKHDSGVESALFYAKAWSKYIKDIMGWMEKRLAMDIECAKSYAKIAETAKTLASQQDYMPFSEIYISTFKNDIENSQVVIQTAVALQTNKFIQPLLARKTELDKMRKDIKEQWQREQKKMHDADASVRKARALQCQRREEYQKAHSSASRSQEEQANGGNKQLERKRRLEEEALLKADEAQDQCRSCLADAGLRKMDLANVKSTALSQLRELIFQCDLTLKAVTVNWFQMQQAQTVSLPAHQQALGQSAKLYEPGQRYSEFVRRLPRDPPKECAHSDSISSDNARFLFQKMSVGSSHSSHGNLSQVSGEVLSGDEVDSPGQSQPGKMEELRSSSSTDLPGQAPLRAWASGSQGSQGGMCSDSESAGGSSESRSMDSPTASPGTDFRVDSDCDSDTGAGDFKRRLPRTPSTGTMSSADDLDDRELHSPSDNGLGEMVTETASSPGPFRNAQMSKAAHTHRLRKLRAPSKCRECDSLVVFHGAECEECSLACHKKCLETLAIQCGHKKLQGRLHLFGIDFAQAAKNSPDGIPFIIKKCTSEIESRALNIKGIYRVNGAKSRVEKLCQAFENGKDLVELSDLSPHDISNVLKLYLRQLPEPLILYRHYNDVIGLAKEGQRALVEEADASRSGQAAEKGSPGVQLTRVLLKMQDLLCKLPTAHYRTLRFLVAHLHRVMEQAEENKMTASNLGIIFGPTLVKPRQATDAEVSLSSLVDYPYQALMVELLVRHFHLLFPREQCSTGGRGSPRLARLEKEQRLSRHSTSLLDIKESAKINKRHSSVLSSSHMLDKELHSGAAPDRLNGVQTTVAGDVQRSTPAFIRPGAIHASASAPKVQLRNQRSRLASRPISMPLERLPSPAQVNERNHRNANASSDTIEEADESEKPRAAASRVSTYYITPFIDTQHMQRRTWDRKYKHYDVTPRTAMIVANLPPASAGVQPPKASAPSSPATPSAGVAGAVSHANFSAMPLRPVWPPKSDGDTEKHPAAAGGLPMTLRAPRTLQPPPGTFYKPPVSAGSKGRTLTNTPTATTNSTPLSPATATQAVATPPEPSRPRQPVLHKQDSVDSTADSEASSAPATLSPPLSPTPSSPDDLRGCGEAKPVYQRQRPRRQQVLEQREAHFV